MALSHQTATSRRVSVCQPDVAEYDSVAFCPLCGREVTPGTPRAPASVILDGEVAAGLDDKVPVFGYECDRHRGTDVILPAPVSLAPDSYVPVDADVDGEVTGVAIPEPVHEAALEDNQ